MAGSERGSMDDIRGQIFTVLGTYEVNKDWRHTFAVDSKQFFNLENVEYWIRIITLTQSELL